MYTTKCMADWIHNGTLWSATGQKGSLNANPMLAVQDTRRQFRSVLQVNAIMSSSNQKDLAREWGKHHLTNNLSELIPYLYPYLPSTAMYMSTVHGLTTTRAHCYIASLGA